MATLLLANCFALHVPAPFLRASPFAAQHGPSRTAITRAHIFCREDGDDELDAMDTVDSWDAQLAEQAAWKAAQMKTSRGASDGVNAETGVDEEAHFGLGDDDDAETPAETMMRQMAEKQAAILGAQMAPAEASGDSKRVLTSLEAVLNTMMALGEKMDRLSAKVDKLQAAVEGGSQGTVLAASSDEAPPSEDGDAPAEEDGEEEEATGAPSAPPASSPSPAPAPPKADEWDGVVDETAWFDDDDDVDLADWRDVRRLKKLLEQTADKPPESEGEGKGEE